MTIGHDLAPLAFGAATYPVLSAALKMGNEHEVLHHSGLLHAALARPNAGRSVMLTLTMPIASALDMCGAGMVSAMVSACTMHQTAYNDAVIASGEVHPTWELDSGAQAIACITEIQTGSDAGMVTATVDVAVLSGDGVTAPVVPGAGALPVLSSQPAVHTMGPVTIAGTAVKGSQSHSISTGLSWRFNPADGEEYATNAVIETSQTTLTISHADAKAVADEFADLASQKAAVALFCREADQGTLRLGGTSISFTAALGAVALGDLSHSHGALSDLGIVCTALSSDGVSFPLAVNEAATAP